MLLELNAALDEELATPFEAEIPALLELIIAAVEEFRPASEAD